MPGSQPSIRGISLDYFLSIHVFGVKKFTILKGAAAAAVVRHTAKSYCQKKNMYVPFKGGHRVRG